MCIMRCLSLFEAVGMLLLFFGFSVNRSVRDERDL